MKINYTLKQQQQQKKTRFYTKLIMLFDKIFIQWSVKNLHCRIILGNKCLVKKNRLLLNIITITFLCSAFIKARLILLILYANWGIFFLNKNL